MSNNIPEFFNIPYITEKGYKIIALSDVLTIFKEALHVDTYGIYAFNLGFYLKNKSFFQKKINQTQEKYYAYEELKKYLQNIFEGSLSYWERLTSMNEPIWEALCV